MSQKTWFVYIVECSDGTFYTGITKDVTARVKKHNSGKGAKYTSERTPVVLKAFSVLPDVLNTQGNALRVEHAIKGLPRKAKVAAVKACGEILNSAEDQLTSEQLNYIEWLVKMEPGKLQSIFDFYKFKTPPHLKG